MNKTVFTAIKWAAAAFLTVFIIAQIYAVLVNPVTTDTVYQYSAYSGYDTSGYIIRNETVVQYSVNGTLSYEIEDGGRVAKNGDIAVVYANGGDADNQAQISQLDARIASFEKIQMYNDLNAADLDSVNSSIHSALTQITDSTQNGNVAATDAYDSLIEYMARRQIITGEVNDFNSLIAAMKSERDALRASVSAPTGRLTSPKSGYVIYSVDGYENVLTPEMIETLTAEKIRAISPETVSSDAVCKVVNDYEWYIAAVMPFNESLNLREGGTVTLRTALSSVPELKATVKYINKQSVTGEAVVIFACDTMNKELAGMRSLDVTVVYEQYDGLKVDNRAIRVVDGVRGVYVLLASQVKFVPVEVLWQSDNYSLVKQETSDSTVLRIYDEIIVKGKNLHDGKIIN